VNNIALVAEVLWSMARNRPEFGFMRFVSPKD
jgi:hypothetical protein